MVSAGSGRAFRAPDRGENDFLDARTGEARAVLAAVGGRSGVYGWRACVRGGLGALRWAVWLVSALRCWRLWRVVARRAVRLCCWCCCSLRVRVSLSGSRWLRVLAVWSSLLVVSSSALLALPAVALARAVFSALVCLGFLPESRSGFRGWPLLEEFKNFISL